MPLGPNALPVVGDTNGVWGTLLNAYLAAIPQQQAATANAGFALQNATPTLWTWTAPNDGNVHIITVTGELIVATAETGGLVNLTFTDPGSNARTIAAFAAGLGVGPTYFFNSYLVAANTAVTLAQGSALTAGAATAHAQLWAA